MAKPAKPTNPACPKCKGPMSNIATVYEAYWMNSDAPATGTQKPFSWIFLCEPCKVAMSIDKDGNVSTKP